MVILFVSRLFLTHTEGIVSCNGALAWGSGRSSQLLDV